MLTKLWVLYKSQGLTLILLIFSLPLLNGKTHAQFKFEQVEEIQGFGEERAYDFYTRSRYNRTEGAFINLGIKFRLSEFQISGDIGYGFEGEQRRYQLQLRKDFFEINKLTLGLSIFEVTDSVDDWIIGDLENSLAALFLREDFKDYFGRKGFKAILNQKVANRHTLRVEYGGYDYQSMERNTNWSLFGGDKKFRENPSVQPGWENSLKLMAALDWRDNPIYPLSGWYFEGIYQRTTGDFDTHGIFVTAKRYQQSFGNQRLLIRGMLGTRKGSLAKQHLMDIGGTGSLRGFKEKEFDRRNRMLMFNINYPLGGDVLRKIPLDFIPLYNSLTLILFIDTGWSLCTDDPQAGLFKGFDKLNLKDIKTDVGVSLSLAQEFIRVDFAKRTDRARDAWRITFRVMEKW